MFTSGHWACQKKINKWISTIEQMLKWKFLVFSRWIQFTTVIYFANISKLLKLKWKILGLSCSTHPTGYRTQIAFLPLNICYFIQVLNQSWYNFLLFLFLLRYVCTHGPLWMECRSSDGLFIFLLHVLQSVNIWQSQKLSKQRGPWVCYEKQLVLQQLQTSITQ